MENAACGPAALATYNFYETKTNKQTKL